MKVGIALEGLMTDMEQEFHIWKQRNQSDASSYLDPKPVKDESFWAMIKSYDDVRDWNCPGELYVLTERPVRLFLPTRSWLKRQGLVVQDKNLIMKSAGGLKRYDCRLHDLDYMIDSDPVVLSTFRYDKCVPIAVDRGRGDVPPWINMYSSLRDVRFESDLRDWKLFR